MPGDWVVAEGVFRRDEVRAAPLEAGAPPPRIAPWLFGTRRGLLTIWASTAFVAFSAFVATEAFGRFGLINASTSGYIIAASALLVLPLILLLLDPVAGLGKGPGLPLPLATLMLLAALTGVAILDRLSDGIDLLSSAPAKTAFFTFLALVFVPRIWSAVDLARHKARNRRAAEANTASSAKEIEQDLLEYRNAESVGAVLATALVSAIIVGAWMVGSIPRAPQLGAGLGVAIFVGVIGIFSAVVFLDWIVRFRPLRAMMKGMGRAAPRMRFLVNFYDWVDAGLVRIGAHVAGADHLKTRTRYSILGGTLVCLAAMSWFLPPPYGLVPATLGFLTALSLSRLWSWVEEDRNLAAITQFNPHAPQKIGFREDFRDETLLGFVFGLVLIPIAMMQAHESGIFGGKLFEGADPNHPEFDARSISTWLGYFGFELAKALPIVDWADIYDLGPGVDSIKPIRPLGMHAVFMARVMVDLILIASLLQAISIASRNRQQKSLYALRRIDRLDELVEKAELRRAIRETRASGGSPFKFDLSKLADPDLVDFRIYNEARLRAMRGLEKGDVERLAFLDQIFDQRGLTPDPSIVLARNLAEQQRNELDLVRVFDKALVEHDSGIHRTELEDLAAIMFELRRTSGMKDFKQHIINTAELRVGASPEARLEMLTTVAVGERGGRDQFQYTSRMATEALLRVLPLVTDPQAVSDSLAYYRANGPEAFGASVHLLQKALSGLEAALDRLSPARR
jgi:hypothetical protein